MTEEIKTNEIEIAEEKTQIGDSTPEAAPENATSETNETEENAVDFTQIAVIKKGDTVKGKIIKVEAEQAIVDIGYKYDGIIPIRELSAVQLENATDAVQVGQEVELKVVSLDDAKEKLVLSKRVIDSEKAWQDLQEKLTNKDVFEAIVADVVKGGLVVDVGLRGFVPASMVERHFVEDFSDYKGRTLKLRVKELDQEKNKVILSQKDVLDEEYEANKKTIMANLQIGQVLDGTVQRLTPFGAFIDIGGIDGLVHISEMAWHHVELPSEVAKEGDQVKVQVLKLDPANDRISLSIKATQPGPWQKVADFTVGSIVTGTVKRLTTFGAFVEIAPGVEGLVHISQIAHRHIATPHEVLEEGQEVSVKILEINMNDKRVSLSIKETEEGPAPTAKSERDSKDGGRDRDRQRPAKKDPAAIEYMAQNNSQGLSQTLGDLFGDKLNKFKK